MGYEGPGAPAGRPTINDVARLAGVSKKTVSRVINNSPNVQERTRKAVCAIIEQTGYVPDPHARSLALGRALLIGFVYGESDIGQVIEVQQGLLEGLEGSGFELVVRCMDKAAPMTVEDLRAFVDGQKLFGLVLAPSINAFDDGLATLSCRWLPITAEAGRELGDIAREAARRLAAPRTEGGTASEAAR